MVLTRARRGSGSHNLGSEGRKGRYQDRDHTTTTTTIINSNNSQQQQHGLLHPRGAEGPHRRPDGVARPRPHDRPTAATAAACI